MANSDLRTDSGFPLDEAVSSLQKEIRRGNIQEAVYWAQEVESRFWKYLWRRLQIISHEDIGVANPLAQMYVYQMWQQYQEHRNEKRADVCAFVVINTVTMLCQSPKTRMADHLLWLVYANPDLKYDVPDYALDKHTARGRSMGRGMKEFLEIGTQVSPAHEEFENKFKAAAYAIADKLKAREWWEHFGERFRRGGSKNGSNADDAANGVGDDGNEGSGPQQRQLL